jgi:hypothetical protein
LKPKACPPTKFRSNPSNGGFVSYMRPQQSGHCGCELSLSNDLFFAPPRLLESHWTRRRKD